MSTTYLPRSFCPSPLSPAERLSTLEPKSDRPAPQRWTPNGAKCFETSARDGTNPNVFEETIWQGFAFLGFHSEWLGGAGKTDVFLKAELGARDRYAVIVEAKTTSRDAVRDGQIDWVTLQEHRENYQADHTAIVGPAFQGDRLAERAQGYGVAVLEAAELAGLCSQHARVPLGLDAYRDLFRLGEVSGVDVVAEHAEEAERWLDLAARVYRLIGELEGDEGALSARDLYWNLRSGAGGISEGFSDEEIEAALEAFASQPIGILRRSAGMYASIGSRTTAARKLRQLANLIEGNQVEPAGER